MDITFNVEVRERTVRPAVEIDFGQMLVWPELYLTLNNFPAYLQLACPALSPADNVQHRPLSPPLLRRSRGTASRFQLNCQVYDAPDLSLWQ